jgi:hypothetical protein
MDDGEGRHRRELAALGGAREGRHVRLLLHVLDRIEPIEHRETLAPIRDVRIDLAREEAPVVAEQEVDAHERRRVAAGKRGRGEHLDIGMKLVECTLSRVGGGSVPRAKHQRCSSSTIISGLASGSPAQARTTRGTGTCAPALMASSRRVARRARLLRAEAVEDDAHVGGQDLVVPGRERTRRRVGVVEPELVRLVAEGDVANERRRGRSVLDRCAGGLRRRHRFEIGGRPATARPEVRPVERVGDVDGGTKTPRRLAERTLCATSVTNAVTRSHASSGRFWRSSSTPDAGASAGTRVSRTRARQAGSARNARVCGPS